MARKKNKNRRAKLCNPPACERITLRNQCDKCRAMQIAGIVIDAYRKAVRR